MLFLTALALFMSASVPRGTTTPENLSNEQVRHIELLRLERDFGDSNLNIVLDGWTSRGPRSNIEDVRFWWFHRDKQGLRSLFGDATRKHFNVRYEYLNSGHWKLNLTADDKRFVFSVELEPQGKLAVFADVRTSSGQVVPHCRAATGKIIARKFLGAAIGIRKVQLTCFDDAGTRYNGSVLSQ